MPYKDPEVRRQRQIETQRRYRARHKDNPEYQARVKKTNERYFEKNREAILERVKANPTAKAHKAAHQRHRVACQLKATPPWLSPDDILRTRCIYEVAAMRNRESDDSWHVDHIVPLRGKTVCGLHVPWNLRVIRAEENLKKGNRLETHI